MDGRAAERMESRTDGGTDGQTNGRADRQLDTIFSRSFGATDLKISATCSFFHTLHHI